MAEILQTQTAYDMSLSGGTDSNGVIKQVWGQEALSNSIKMWLASYRGDVLRDPRKCGVLIKYLTKQMSEDSAIEMRADLYDKLTYEFLPELRNIEVQVNPDYEKRKWNIFVKAWSPDIKDYVEVNASIKNLV